MNTRLLIYLLFTFFIAKGLNAQSTLDYGLMPSININKDLGSGWGVNFKIETRNLIDNGIQYNFSEMALTGSKKVGIASRFTFGYLARVKQDLRFHRISQQFSTVSRFDLFRVAWRLGSDQYFKDGFLYFRIGGKITAEIPFNGTKVDAKEFYLKVSNEYLSSFENSEHELEIRLAPLVGYKIKESSKIEIGPDYRVSDVFSTNFGQTMWMSLKWYLII